VHVFQYWELFLDLLLVAAASAVTDQFKNNLNWNGFFEFVVFYMVILNGWMLYSHHVTARFHDASLVHSMNLFLYSFGFGLCNVNTGYNTTQQFCWGAFLMRFSVLIMLVQLSSLERARYTCCAMGILTLVAMLAFLVVALFGSDVQEKPAIMAIFWIAALIEFFGEVYMLYIFTVNRIVPINIEQSKERLGAMEMIFLGETILSVTLIYRELMEEEKEEAEDGEFFSISFYWVLGWAFLLIFMFLLLYFHMQPDPDDHAFRRSRIHGSSLLILNKLMGLAFLAVGVSVKLVVECVLLKEEMPAFASQLMSYAVSFGLFSLFLMRYLHYGGRTCLNFGQYQMKYGDDQFIDAVTMIWWWTFGIAVFIPLMAIFSAGELLKQDSLLLIGSHAVFLFVLVLLETFYTHIIQDSLKRRSAVCVREEEPLTARDSKTYS